MFETPQGLEGAPMGYGATSSTGAAVNRVAVLAAINVTLMMIGALVMQNKALVQGKDPYDMTEGKFWMRAMAQGGGAGYVGDLLFKDPTEQRGSNVEQGVGAIPGRRWCGSGPRGRPGVVNAWEAAKGKGHTSRPRRCAGSTRRCPTSACGRCAALGNTGSCTTPRRR